MISTAKYKNELIKGLKKDFEIMTIHIGKAPCVAKEMGKLCAIKFSACSVWCLSLPGTK